MMFRPFYYPSTALVKSSAYGMLFQNSFNVYRNAADDAWTNVYTNIGFANQRASLSSGGDSQMQHIPEVSYEVQLQQYYFKEFGFLVSGAMFQYLRPVNGINVPEASFDQGDLVYMGTQAAIRKFPRWTGGVEFSRKDNPDDPGNVIYVGYHYVAYSHPEPAAHHANVGCRIKIVDQSSVDVGYDWIAADSRDKRNYYHVELRVAF